MSSAGPIALAPGVVDASTRQRRTISWCPARATLRGTSPSVEQSSCPPGTKAAPVPGIAAPFTALDPGVLMSIGAILLILLILVLIGVLPAWPYSGTWGYGPIGIVGVVLIAVVLLMALGTI
jgi:hypothetical protein